MLAEEPTASYGNPQIEDGHTRIANELFEAVIKFDFSKRQLKVVLFIIRKTYGYNKKTDQMSISQICAGTGLDHSATVKAVAELVSMGVVSKQHGQYAQVIGLNKKYQSWGVVLNQHPSVKTTPKGVSKQHIAGVNLTPTKETTKENTKRKGEILLTTYLQDCKSKSIKPIKDDCAAFKFADTVKIPRDWVALAWHSFKEKHIEKGTKKTDWAAHFNNAVKNNWEKIWWVGNDKVPTLTSHGRTIEMLLDAQNG